MLFKRLISLFLLSLLFFACSEESGKVSVGKIPLEKYLGAWKGNEMRFEVVREGNSSNVLIKNENGVLKAEYKDGKITGKNELDMEFSMEIKKDSAFYTFAGITTTYSRE